MIAVVSDAHLTRADEPAQADLVAWLDQLDAEEIVLAGDLFHTWWGGWGRVQPRYRPAIHALGRAVGRGTQVTWIAGNHDFRVGQPATAALNLRVTGRWERSIGCRTVVVVHGDEADTSIRYAFTRRLLRGRAFSAVVDRLGERRGEALLERLAGASRDHGGPQERLVEAQRRWARRELRRGAGVVCLGHSHALGVVPTPAGLIVHLGDWGRQRSWLRLDRDDITLTRWRQPDGT